LYTQWNAFPKRKAELSTWGLLTTTTTCAWLLLQKQSLCPLKLQNTQFALGVTQSAPKIIAQASLQRELDRKTATWLDLQYIQKETHGELSPKIFI
jgi:hypothetical protein